MNWAQRTRVRENGHYSFLAILWLVAHSEQRKGDNCGRGLHDTPYVGGSSGKDTRRKEGATQGTGQAYLGFPGRIPCGEEWACTEGRQAGHKPATKAPRFTFSK